MRTIQKIKDEIADLQKSAIESNKMSPDDKRKLSESKIKALGKRVTFLTKCIYFLESFPNEQSLITQLEDVVRKVSVVYDGFSKWQKFTPETAEMKNPKAHYENLMNLKEYKLQSKTLKYLLEK